ncbi:tetratricopeptide repeat protein [bacterium]|nr:MAG: tetratricopeptide repeat protein [bacterium]
MAQWRIEVLGGVRASYGERVVDRFPTQRTAALLAYLALFPRVAHPREALAETLWSDADPESQRHSLRLALSRLRALLGSEHPLEAGRSMVRLDPARFVTDVAEFEGAVARGDARTAHKLYAGPLLPGHYEEWVIDQQARLEALLETIVESDGGLPPTLPQGLGKLFGREAERLRILALLEEGRQVTLTGPGGMGKTRLAVAVSREHGQAVWVSLVDLLAPDQVADALRMALRLPAPAPGFPVVDMVARELTEVGPVLLVLDNAEHLVSEELSVLVRRLAEIPGVSLLVTSRRALGTAYETEVPVGPLDEVDGAALFEERARRARPGVNSSEEARRALARRLGGMPLALELAAARAGVQGLAEIEAGGWAKENAFGGSLGIPVRQRSLSAVLRDSLALLPEKRGVAFARLSVFRGGFDAAAAFAVAEADLATLDDLRRWSLIVASDEPDGSVRFRMLEPLRDVAQDERGEAEIAHARYFADWVEANRADDLPPPPRRLGQRLALQERERDNIRAALETCRASGAPSLREVGLRIVAAYWTYWFIRNAGTEMEETAKAMLEGAGEAADSRIQAAARLSLALALRERGAREEAAAEVKSALISLREGSRDRNLAFAWHLRGFSQADLGHGEEAEGAYLEAETIWKEIGDDRNFSITRHNRGMLAAERGDLDSAERLVGEAMDLFRAHCSTYEGIGNSTIGDIRRARSDYAGAAAAYAEAARFHRQMGYVRGWAQNERDYAFSLHAQGRSEEAKRWAEGALAAFRRVGDRHGEATALAALAQITGEAWLADEARGILVRYNLPAVGGLLAGL